MSSSTWDPGPRRGADQPAAVLVELAASSPDEVRERTRSLAAHGFTVDADYEPVPMQGEQPTFIVRGTIDDSRIADLEAVPGVVRVWRDTPIAPFDIAP